MMKIILIFVLIIFSQSECLSKACNAEYRPCEGLKNFSPTEWPGAMPAEKEALIKTKSGDWLRTVRGNDRAAIRQMTIELKEVLGTFVSVPEVRPVYYGDINTQRPETKVLTGMLVEELKGLRGDAPWESSTQQHRKRLRVSVRLINLALSTSKLVADRPDESQELRNWALAGSDYLISCQASNGVFGYPYNPGSNHRLDKEGIAIVQRGESSGRKMVEDGWIVDDLGTGGLNFDNGISGILLVEIWKETEDERFLQSAIRAGRWAAEQPLVLNWNYNAFSGRLYSKLYTATKDPEWLDLAKHCFSFGVLPGQGESGRWMDPHNCRIQYHSILCEALVDYYLALKLAGDPAASVIKDRIQVGLDNLSCQISSYGSSNIHEQISTKALVAGLKIVGARQAWIDALHINMNALLNENVRILMKRNAVLLPASLGDGLVFLKEYRCE